VALHVLMGRAMLRASLALTFSLVACGREPVSTPPASPAKAVTISLEARTQAAEEAARERFHSMVIEKYVERGVTVRGLVRSLSQAKPTAGEELLPARFDPQAGAAAKLEVVNGKVIYTAVAKADDPAAAVITDGQQVFSVGYVVEAEVVPAAGELGAITVRQVTEPRRVN